VDVYDPHANADEVHEEFGIHLIDSIQNTYDAIILSVSHKEFKTLDVKGLLKSSESVLFDTKAFLDRAIVDARL
jgi:UDP-N-acetyl-D-galactosamine dehydrogenase